MKAVSESDELRQREGLSATARVNARGAQCLLSRIRRAGQLSECATQALATLGEGRVNYLEYPLATRLAGGLLATIDAHKRRINIGLGPEHVAPDIAGHAHAFRLGMP